MHVRLVYILILINILNAFAVPYWSNILSKRRKYCGSDVTFALSEICERNHYETTMKRSELLEFFNRLKSHLNSAEIEFLPSSQDLAESLSPAKSREGITEECCFKECSRDELKTYCAAYSD